MTQIPQPITEWTRKYEDRLRSQFTERVRVVTLTGLNLSGWNPGKDVHVLDIALQCEMNPDNVQKALHFAYGLKSSRGWEGIRVLRSRNSRKCWRFRDDRNAV